MTYAVILAAGCGKRMNTKIKKQYLKINNKTIICYSIDKFLSMRIIDNIIIVVNYEDRNSIEVKRIFTKYNKEFLNGKLIMITGGKERYDSVFNSLNYINNYIGINRHDNIIIHDSARPNFNVNDVKNLIKHIYKYKAITLASSIKYTIKETKNSLKEVKEVIKTHDRNNFYLIHTPQAFKLKLLYDCYQKFRKSKSKNNITDDLQIIEYFSNEKTYILNSSSKNIKITTKDDLEILNNIM